MQSEGFEVQSSLSLSLSLSLFFYLSSFRTVFFPFLSFHDVHLRSSLNNIYQCTQKGKPLRTHLNLFAVTLMQAFERACRYLLEKMRRQSSTRSPLRQYCKPRPSQPACLSDL